LGHNSFIQHRYHKAVANFRKAIDLKGSLALAWTEMGECLHRLGLESEARDAWREALRVEPQKAQSVAIAKAPEKPAPVAQLIAKDSLQLVKEDKTTKGTKIASAIKSVVALTRSLGTPVVEKGWKIRKMGEKTLVSYLCEQGGGALESFDWLVDVDTRQVLPHNDNARLLMSRW
jgi:tetratricopeptide (TPR) repeat protein